MIRVHPLYLFALAAALLVYLMLGILNSARLNSWIETLTAPSATISTVYLLDQQAWTEFDIVPPDGMVRLLLNAIAEDAAVMLDMPPLEFAVEYEFLDESGNSLGGQQRHFMRASISFLEKPDQAEPQPASNLTRPFAAVVSAAQLLLLDSWAYGPRADRLRLRWVPRPDESRVRGVIARSYTRTQLSEHEDTTGWLRLNRFNRNRLAADLAYPPELLEADDQHALLRSQWAPVGPMGIDGIDYFSARLRLNADDQAQTWSAGFLPWGLYCDAQRIAVIPYSASSGRIRVEITPLQEGADAHAQLTWYPADPGPPAFATMHVDETPEHAWAQGWLAVQTPVPATVRLFDAQSNTELTPEPLQSVASMLPAGQTLEYALNPVLEEPTPLRLDIRRSGQGSAPLKTLKQTLRYRWLDAAGNMLDQAELAFSLTPSAHDWVGSRPQDNWVSDAHSLYWLVPPEAVRLQLQAPDDLLVTAYDRPLNLRHVIDIPDAYRPWMEHQRQPVWFRLRPVRGTDAGNGLIRRQPRPPERDPDLLAGRWHWRNWPASGAPAGSWFLLPQGDLGVDRLEALGARFTPLAINHPLTLTLAADHTGARIQPELLFRNRSVQSLPRVRLNGRWLDLVLPAWAHGRISLPELPAGEHELYIEDHGTGQWLINHQQKGVPGYLRMYAQRLEPGQTLAVPVQTQGKATTLSVRTLLRIPPTPAEADGPNPQARTSARAAPRPYAPGTAELLITARRPLNPSTRPKPAWSIDERLYRVRLDEDAMSQDPLKLQWRAAQTLLMPLGEDWPAQDTSLEIRLLSEAPVYIAVHELIPGIHSDTRIRKDEPFDAP